MSISGNIDPTQVDISSMYDIIPSDAQGFCLDLVGGLILLAAPAGHGWVFELFLVRDGREQLFAIDYQRLAGSRLLN